MMNKKLEPVIFHSAFIPSPFAFSHVSVVKP